MSSEKNHKNPIKGSPEGLTTAPTTQQQSVRNSQLRNNQSAAATQQQPGNSNQLSNNQLTTESSATTSSTKTTATTLQWTCVGTTSTKRQRSYEDEFTTQPNHLSFYSLPVDFQEVKRHLRTKSGKRPIKV